MTVAIRPSLPHDLVTGVDTVVFDVVGTLLEPAPSVSEAYKNSAEKFGYLLPAREMPSDLLSHGRNRKRWMLKTNQLSEQVEVGSMNGGGRLYVMSLKTLPKADKIFDDLWLHFGKPSSWQPVEQGCRLLETVRESGIGVAIASNFDERLLPLAKQIEPLVHIENIFASSELGWRETSPTVLPSSGVTASERAGATASCRR